MMGFSPSFVGEHDFPIYFRIFCFLLRNRRSRNSHLALLISCRFMCVNPRPKESDELNWRLEGSSNCKLRARTAFLRYFRGCIVCSFSSLWYAKLKTKLVSGSMHATYHRMLQV